MNSEKIKWLKTICWQTKSCIQDYQVYYILEDSSPYSRIRVTTDSLFFDIVLSISFILFNRVDRSAWNKGQRRKKWNVVSLSKPQLQRRFRVSWKLCLNLCSRRWLRTSLNFITNLIPFGLWYWKTMLRKILWILRYYF